MNAINWTAIVVLMLANVLAWAEVRYSRRLVELADWRASDRLSDAKRAEQDATNLREINGELRRELDTERRLHRNLLAKNQRKRGKELVGATDMTATQTEQHNASVPEATGRIRDVGHSARHPLSGENRP